MEKLAIGKIGGPFGVHGYSKVTSLSGEVEHFYKLISVILKRTGLERELRIADVKPYKKSSLLIKFEGILSPESAKELTGMEIWVPRSQASKCGKDEYYYSDLSNCDIYKDGNYFGRTKGICDTNAGQLLEVAGTEGKSVLIPFTSQFIGDVNIKEKRIELLHDVDA